MGKYPWLNDRDIFMLVWGIGVGCFGLGCGCLWLVMWSFGMV